MMKLYRFLKMSFVIVCVFASVQALAQTVQITGRVVSGDDGTALPGVSIVEKGTTNGTVTDADGNYSVNVGSDATLVFSFVGFTSQEASVSGKTKIDITLSADVTALNEIVVVGYGQQERKDVTGSVTAVTTKDFNKGVLSSPQDLLIGKLAGVQVTQNTGAPGSGATIRIRGGSSLSASNDPLIVIDGFPVDNKTIGGSANPLATLNPNDIESFTVLKDASSTAIYGSRASNGVIIITTKKGKDGKPQVAYNGNVSVSTPVKYFDVLSAEEFSDVVTEVADEGIVSGLTPADVDLLGVNRTDWQKEIYRNAVSHDHNVSVAGSVKAFPYRVSYGYTDQQGTLKNTNSKRNSLNVNFNPSFLDDNLRVTLTAKASNTKNSFGNTGAVGGAIGFDPTQPVRNGNTKWGGFFTWTQDPDDVDGTPIDLAPSNPVAMLELTDNTSTVNRLLGNIQVDYRLPFLPELRINVNAGIDYTKSDGVNNVSVKAPWATDPGEGEKTSYTGKNESKLFDIYANYVKTIGNSKIDATVGHSYQSFENFGSNFRTSWNGNKKYDYQIGAEEDTIPRQYVPDLNFLLSFFGRIHYSYKEKYLLTASLRSDGSSRFHEDNRWGMFPSFAIGWNAKQEEFLAPVEALSNLKVRLSYGITGQQNIYIPGSPNGSYPYLPVYQVSTPTAQYQFGNTFYPTLRPNPYDGGIKWEETTTLNLGVDFGLFGDKLTGTIDVYNRETKDLLNNTQVSNGSAFSNYLWTNIGTLENKGIEVTLNAKVIDTEDISWNIGYNITHNRNRITKLIGFDDPSYEGVATGTIAGGVGNMVQEHSVGHPANSFYVYQQVYDAAGDPIEGLYVDKISDGAISNKRHYKSPYPKVLMGIFSTVRYKNFDFYFSGRLSLGNYVYNNRASASTYSSLFVSNGGSSYFNNLASYINDTHFVNAQYWSDIYVEDASFFKMDNISLGYNFNSLLKEKLKARVSFTVQNAFTITDYSGIDPEVNDGTNPGIDNNIYPRSRNFVLGVSLTY